MTMLQTLNTRVARLEAAVRPASAPRLVLLVGPEGLSAEQRAQVDEAQRAGRAVTFIELVPAVGTVKPTSGSRP